MNHILLAMIGLRAAALGLTLSGQSKVAGSLYLLADTIAAGQATDLHLKTIAEKLAQRDLTDEDWDDVAARIEADSARLQAGAPDDEPPTEQK